MPLSIRALRADEATAFLELHHASVRGVAARDYPPETIADWAPLPVTEAAIRSFLDNPEGERRLAAELDDRLVGVGVVVVGKRELRACYVAPDALRQGVGSALVREIERIARAEGLDHLWLHASITAEPFYLSLGYRALERSEHRLRSGRRMACVTMRKDFNL